MDKAARLRDAVGADALWAAAVAASEALTAYTQELDAVREAARQVGITDEAWEALALGHSLPCTSTGHAPAQG